MNDNFKMNRFVRLNLLANGQPTYISVSEICQIYEDTSGRGEKGVRIHFKNDDYTFVEGPLDSVMYAIDEVLNPDWYKEACDEECEAWDNLITPMDESIHRDMEKLTLSESYAMIQNFVARKTQCDGCVREKNCNENFEVCVYLAACKKLEEALRKAGEL